MKMPTNPQDLMQFIQNQSSKINNQNNQINNNMSMPGKPVQGNNPFAQMMNSMNGKKHNSGDSNDDAPSKNEHSKNINPDKFRNMSPQLSNAVLKTYILQARKDGISDADIDKGLEYIRKLQKEAQK